MISLFIDTSSSCLNIALLNDNNIIKIKSILLGKDLSKEALYEIKCLIESANLKPNDIDRVVCVSGPGSFTGLRVGVTISKVFCFSLNKQLYSLSTLSFMASSIKDSDYIVPVIDARRNFVYAGIYDKNYKSVLSDRYIGINKLKEEVSLLKGKITYVSMDNFDDLDVVKFVPDVSNTFKNIPLILENHFMFEPKYLKLTEAEENLNNGSGN